MTYTGYPAFASDGPDGNGRIMEEVPSAVGMAGFYDILSENTFDMYRWKATQMQRDARLRPCSIIPRGHPARSTS